MSSEDAVDTVTTAAGLVERYGSLATFVRRVGFGGIFYALITVVVDAIYSMGDLLLAPWRAMASGLSDLVGGTFGQALRIVEAGTDTAVTAFSEGLTALLGPFAFPFAIALVMVAIYVAVELWMRTNFSPTTFLSR